MRNRRKTKRRPDEIAIAQQLYAVADSQDIRAPNWRPLSREAEAVLDDLAFLFRCGEDQSDLVKELRRIAAAAADFEIQKRGERKCR